MEILELDIKLLFYPIFDDACTIGKLIISNCPLYHEDSNTVSKELLLYYSSMQ